jgi:ketosteroid isomerase-like protein
MTIAATSPEHAVELLDQAFNEGNLDAVLSFYEDAAVVAPQPHRIARGTGELRAFFVEAMRSRPSAKQIKTRVLEADGIALFLSRWTLVPKDGSSANATTFVATTVFRRQPDGHWKILIDNPLGPILLDAN